MVFHRPQRSLLTVWRVYLVVGALIPAFLISLICNVLGLVWSILTGVWLVLFMAAYMWYLPSLFDRQGFCLEKDKITRQGGVIYKRSVSIPLDNIQYVSQVTTPLDRLFKLGTVAVAAPGGRIMLYGLSAADATELMDVLCQSYNPKQREG